VKQEAVRVVIGLDDTLPSMQNFVLIGAPARSGTDMVGIAGGDRADAHGLSAHDDRGFLHCAPL
jgi:hypothetical protein